LSPENTGFDINNTKTTDFFITFYLLSLGCFGKEQGNFLSPHQKYLYKKLLIKRQKNQSIKYRDFNIFSVCSWTPVHCDITG